MSTLTLIGLERFMERREDDLFKEMVLPVELSRDDVKDTILMRGSEFEVVYADPYFLQKAIGLWSRKWNRTFQKWSDALKIEYNPLDNYDRTEEWTDTNTGTVSNESTSNVENNASNESTSSDVSNVNRENTMSDSSTTLNTGTVTDATSSSSTGTVTVDGTSGTDGSDTTTGGGTNNTTNSVTAYDNNNYVGHDKSENTTSSSSSSTQHTEGSSNTTTTNDLHDLSENKRTDDTKSEVTGIHNADENITQTSNKANTDSLNSTTDSSNSSTRTDDLIARHTGRIRGNIGVMSSQELLTREIEVARFNIYEQIADCFVQEFCIMIY